MYLLFCDIFRDFVEKKCKIIYIFCNFKDVVVFFIIIMYDFLIMSILEFGGFICFVFCWGEVSECVRIIFDCGFR